MKKIKYLDKLYLNIKRTNPLLHVKCRQGFTLIELVVAMAVFSVIMLVMMSLFGSVQKVWTTSIGRSSLYDNARLAMDLVSRDLQSAYYAKDITPFAVDKTADNGAIAFISATDIPQNDKRTSPYSEVKYKIDSGWLKRSVTSNKDDSGNANTNWDYSDPAKFSTAFNTSEPFHKVVPYLTSLSFATYKLDGSDCPNDQFPAIVKVQMSFLGKNSYAKWKALSDAGASNANEYKENHEHTFTKIIFLGNRGQE